MQSKVRSSVLDFRVLLCLILVWCIILSPMGEINQKAKAIVGVDDALIGILIAGLAAVGITFVSTGAYNSLTEYVGSLLDQYAGSIGTTGQGLFTGVQTGANGIGQILVNNRMVRLISGFATWLRLHFSLTDNAAKEVVKAGASIDDIICYALPVTVTRVANSGEPKTWEYITISGSNLYAAFATQDTTNYVVVFSSSQGTVREQRIRQNGTVAQTDRQLSQYSRHNQTPTNYYWYIFTVANPLQSNPYEWMQMQDVVDALCSNQDLVINDVSVSVNTGAIAPPLDSPDYEDGDGAIIDVAAPWGMTYPDIVNKWLPKEWAPGMSGNPSMTYDAAPAIDEQVQTGPETAQVSSDPGEYAVPGLQSVFPFCIPFDIYNLLSALAADPVAPSFTWRFYVPRVCDETFTVDLSPFDTVAQIVRTVELLAFIVGLAMVTRERFLRG